MTRMSRFDMKQCVFSVLTLFFGFNSSFIDGVTGAENHPAPMLSPKAAMKSIQMQDDYYLELAASDPHIHEPAVIEWDGNGKMYVAEMLTYMQDIDGTDELTPRSRVTLMEDTDWDGVYDKSTVFVDNLLLPRMLMCIEDEVIIRETNTFDLYAYKDTDGDGKADSKRLIFEGGRRGGNLEHQPSGLVWNMDNWIYTTYSNHRFRWQDGVFIRERLPAGSGQWGIGKDDIGHLYYSTAGGETPVMDFQQPIVYGRIRIPGELPTEFRICYPIDNIPDVQGGLRRVRDDNTLNWFTGIAGQSIYRGDRLPKDLYGDLIIPEPVGRLIRRAKMTNQDGMKVPVNAYPNSEFMRTKDGNFRPVNSATAPDGTLYIVDMYRGIIQEGNWVRKGSYLRPVVQKYRLDENIRMGRIYRLRHPDFERGPRPNMLNETNQQIVKHLSHPNGWWRDMAQRLLIIRQAEDAIPALKASLKNNDSSLGRLHALWTLEGLGAISPELVNQSLSDKDWKVRHAAVRISETLLTEKSNGLLEKVTAMGKDKKEDHQVANQIFLSLQQKSAEIPDAMDRLNSVLASHPENKTLTFLGSRLEDAMRRKEEDKLRRMQQEKENKVTLAAVDRGKAIYQSLCFACHGEDGKGMKVPGMEGMTLAPSLVGSKRVKGDTDILIRILVHGLTGPVDGKEYPGGIMAPMGSNTDEWLADVTTFIRNSWGNKGSRVDAQDIATVRKVEKGRTTPWTLSELLNMDPKQWKVTAAPSRRTAKSAVDGDPSTRFSTNEPASPGQWFQIQFPYPKRVKGITLDTTKSRGDYPRKYEVFVSQDGKDWGKPVAKGSGVSPITKITFEPQVINYLRIVNQGTAGGLFWSIHELTVH